MRETILRFHIGLVTTIMPLLVRFIPMRGLLWLVEQPAGWTPYRGVPSERIIEMTAHRLRNPRNMRRRRCLRHGMTLFHFLRLAAVPAVMHFGVLGPATSGQRLHAHCWVTVNGKVVDPPLAPVAIVLTRGYEPLSA